MCRPPPRPTRSPPITALADRPATRRPTPSRSSSAPRASVRGSVAADSGTRALYSSDASNYRVLPAASWRPGPRGPGGGRRAGRGGRRPAHDARRRDQHRRQRDRARARGGPLTAPRRRSWRWTRTARTATVLPGTVLDDLNRAAAAHGLRVGPDPSTHSRCTVGGMIGNNACGSRSVRWGTTAENTLGLEVVTADGVAGGGRGRSARRSTAQRSPSVGSSPHGDADPPRAAAVAAAGVRLRPGLAAAGARRGRRPGARGHRGDVRRGLGGHAPAGPAAGRAGPPRARVRGRHRGRGGGPGAAAGAARSQSRA